MCWSLCKITEPIARKRYRCDATSYLFEMQDYDVDEEDKKTFKELMENPFIEKREKYIKTKGIYDHMFLTCRAKKKAHAFCLKYELYQQELC